jgi:hypothetical protein
MSAKQWSFTLNNYTDDELLKLSDFDNIPSCEYILFGKETAPETNTPHLQGFIRFSKRMTRVQVSRIIPRAWLEPTKKIVEYIAYCKKEGDFYEFGQADFAKQGKRSDLEAFKEAVKDGCFDIDILMENHSKCWAKYEKFCRQYIRSKRELAPLDVFPLTNWQQQLNQTLLREPDSRTIHFIIDFQGNAGKTWFALYYCNLHQNAQYLLPGKKADMAYALRDDLRVLFIDAPRSKQGEQMQYGFLEEVKNGQVSCSKYESCIKKYNKMHVVVMMNENPDMTKLSYDRYNIITVNKEF